MNKTVTVNIGGMVFHIEEQAYDKLKRYLEAIKGYFTSSDGRDEIIQDIESRIAEVFTERIGTSRQVVTETDVDAMIDTMGRPEQVAGADDEQSGANTQSNAGPRADFGKGADPFQKGYRKLYRDPDDKVVGGVCSGMAHYFGMDPLWLRLIFAILFFGWGTGFLAYMILLIIIPKAKTTAEKLEMKGQPVTIDNIRRTIEDEVDDIRTRLKSDHPFVKRSSSGIARFFEVLGEIILGAFKLLGKIIAVFILFVLAVVLFALFVTALGINGWVGGVNLPVYLTDIFLTPTQLNWATVGLCLVIGIPLLALFVNIISGLFKIKAKSRILNYASLSLWIIGVIISIWIGANIAREFRVKDQDEETLALTPVTADTLYLEKLHADNTDEAWDDNSVFFDGHNWSVGSHGDTLHLSMVELDIQRANGTMFELENITRGRGSDRRTALSNIREINYKFEQQDSVLRFADHYDLNKGTKFRGQHIKLILRVPVGKSVFLGSGMGDVIYDVKNRTNTYDLDMIGKTWTMTPKGLECIGCNLGDDTNDDSSDSNDESWSSNDDENVHIRVNGKTVKGKHNTDTIDWDHKDIKVHINDKNITIDAKDTK